MLFLFSLVILFACKPWRYLPLFRSSTFKVKVFPPSDSIFRKLNQSRHAWSPMAYWLCVCFIIWLGMRMCWLIFLIDSFIIDLFALKGNPKSDYFLLQLGELQRPLVSDGDGEHLNQGQTGEEGSREYDLEGACYQNEGILQGRAYKQRLPSSSPHLNQGKLFAFPSWFSFGESLHH